MAYKLHHLLTVGDITYRTVCYARGLIDGDEEWIQALDEASQLAFAFQVHHLFVTLRIFCEVISPFKLWTHCWKYLADDIEPTQRRLLGFPNLNPREEQLHSYTLLEIEKLMHQHDRSLSDYSDMPLPDKEMMKDLKNTFIMEEQSHNLADQLIEHEKLFSSFNDQQKMVFDEVMDSVNFGRGKLFFLYCHGGTGKTYLYKTVITKLRSDEKIVVPVASSGIAALLLPGSRTAHSRFKILINLAEHSMCDIKPGSIIVELLKAAHLIIWD